MTFLHFAINFDKFKESSFLIDFILGAILLLILVGFVTYNLKRKFTFIFYGAVCSALLSAVVFDMEFVVLVASMALVVGTIVFLFVNISEIRRLIANPLKTKIARDKFSKKNKTLAYSTASLYKAINDAVVSLSKSKTGALITFQKKESLTEAIKSGSIINAPVTAELIQTIFYPGTRLHDGAIVIKGNIIVAASVYYTPTTKPLMGKYGARHRAGLGISEVTDSVTVIVSEETGRVSIAYNGDLESTTLDNFLRVFEDHMEDAKGK